MLPLTGFECKSITLSQDFHFGFLRIAEDIPNRLGWGSARCCAITSPKPSRSSNSRARTRPPSEVTGDPQKSAFNEALNQSWNVGRIADAGVSTKVPKPGRIRGCSTCVPLPQSGTRMAVLRVQTDLAGAAGRLGSGLPWPGPCSFWHGFFRRAKWR